MSNFCGGFDSYRGFGGGRSQPANSSWDQAPSSSNSARTAIKDLSPHQPNTVIIGIVITKQSIHSFPDKKNPGCERSKFTFTLRDSPSDYINVTCWGSEGHIRKTSDSFKICDVVEVQNAQISSKTGGEQEDRWQPWTPSQYQINASETHSTIGLYSGWDYTEFMALAHVPIRPPNDYYPLGDVLANGQALDGSHINILAIVKNTGTPKEMTSRSGKPLKKCEVKLTDNSCTSFSLFMWDDELIELAQTWTPKENIIFASDVKVSFDSYRNSMVATCNQKTIITTNPDCREAHQLYQFAQSLASEGGSQEEEGEAAGGHQDDVQSISQVYTMEQVMSAQDEKSQCGGSFLGMMFPLLTSLDIDEDISSAICHRCTSCKVRVDEGSTHCPNKACPSMSSSAPLASEPHYSLLISLSDHTGGLDRVRLSGKPASDLLQRTPQEFLLMGAAEKTELKASLLLERFKVYFKSGISTSDQWRPNVRVLSMSLADPAEAVSYLG